MGVPVFWETTTLRILYSFSGLGFLQLHQGTVVSYGLRFFGNALTFVELFISQRLGDRQSNGFLAGERNMVGRGTPIWTQHILSLNIGNPTKVHLQFWEPIIWLANSMNVL